MKKITLSLLVMFASLGIYAQENGKQTKVFGRDVDPSAITPSGHIRCISNEYEAYLAELNPKRATKEQFENWLAPLIQEYKLQQQTSSQSGGIIYIPVVVHVIHNGDAYGTNENITDEQVQSQITVMTQDFRRMVGTPGYNTNSVGADTQIEFVLAKVDPNGNPTNGINRVNLCQDSWSTTAINSTVKPSTIWDPTLYMNMWSVNFTDGSLLGYAQFPDASGLPGLNTSGGAANTDGVVAGYRFFGSSDLATGNFQAPFDKGRTMTHEVGHYLGLRHIWGDGGCTVDDFCADTPVAGAANYGCPAGTNSCTGTSYPGNDMIENYMDYTDDTCMNIFTQNQKDRMVVIMNNAARRASLKTSTKDIAIPLFANDAEVIIENSCGAVSPTCANPNPTSPAKIVSLYNRGNTTMTAATLSYNMDGGTAYTQNWTGSLAPNKFAYVTLTNTTTSGTLNVSVTSVNGTTDQRASNNTASKTFGAGGGSSLPNHAFTTFNFTLIGDRYGTETTWNLKNAAGTTLYSGGPYTNLSTNTTQTLVNNVTWTLPANGCYTFTINDSYGDGICCAYGSGSYTITTNSGATVVANSTAFTGSTESKSFSNNALSTDAFELVNAIVLYPNPAKNNITVNIPNGIQLEKASYSIYNALGQKVLVNAISNNIQDVNISNLSTGVYVINLDVNGVAKTMKFIKE